MHLGAKSRVGVLRGKNEDLDEGLKKQAMKQGALMLCALSPEPSIEALRLGPLHTVDNGVFCGRQGGGRRQSSLGLFLVCYCRV